MHDTCDGRDKYGGERKAMPHSNTKDAVEKQIEKSARIIANLHEHVKLDNEYPAGTKEEQMDTLLEQIDATLYAAEKLKEINDFIDDEYIKEVVEFGDEVN